MQAIRIHPSPGEPWSATNPATSSCLHLDEIPIPQLSKPGELLVRIKATTIIRDMLTWPEMLAAEYMIPGHDFAGIVESTFDDQTSFKPGDEVFGMIHADRGGAWAQYVIVMSNELALKPKNSSWEEAASIPLSALTAWQALFRKAQIPAPAIDAKEAAHSPDNEVSVLVTGASGCVGNFLVRFGHWAGCQIIAATSSNPRNEHFLDWLGALGAIEYQDFWEYSDFDVVIDTVGGEVLEKCWGMVAESGTLISIDSSSWDFVNEHRKRDLATRDDVKAQFFIVEPNSEDLAQISNVMQQGNMQGFVSSVYPLSEVRQAYDAACSRDTGPASTAQRGKAVLTIP